MGGISSPDGITHLKKGMGEGSREGGLNLYIEVINWKNFLNLAKIRSVVQ